MDVFIFCLLFLVLPSALTYEHHNYNGEVFHDDDDGGVLDSELMYEMQSDADFMKKLFHEYRDVSDPEEIVFPGDNDDILVPPIPKHFVHKKHCQRKPEYQYTTLDCKLTIETLKVMLNFFLANADKIIADGLFGMRLAEGAIVNLAKNLPRNHYMYSTIAKLAKIAADASNRVFEKVKKKNRKYDRRFLTVLDAPSNFFRSWRNSNESLVWQKKIKSNKEFSEKLSDKCVGEVLGSNPDSKRKCVLSKKCLEIETKPRTQNYYLTHQILYFIAAQTHGCGKKLNKVFGSKENLDKYYDAAAANMNQEMENTKEPNSDQLDLYSEQGCICSMLGIVECTQRHKLYDVMKFVDSKGCIIEDARLKKKRRKKRVDVTIDGCSQHTGAVVMGYLAHHLRAMLLPRDCQLFQ